MNIILRPNSVRSRFVLALGFAGLLLATPIGCSSDKDGGTDAPSDSGGLSAEDILDGETSDTERLDTSSDTASDSASDTTADLSEDTEPSRDDLELVAVQNPSNSLSYFINWTTPEAVPTVLDVDCGADYQEHFEDDQARTEHEVFVMGLFDGAQCEATATFGPDDEATGSTTFSAGPLPDVLPQLEIPVAESDKIQQGWTLFNLSNFINSVPLMLAMVDHQGRYRWYHQVATSHHGSDNDLRTVDGGVLLGGTWGNIFPQIIDWQGKVLWKRELPTHHAVRPMEDDKLIYLQISRKCNGGMRSDQVRIYDRSEDKVTWEWHICEHWQPENPVPDWPHLNSVAPIDAGQSVLLSARNQHSIFKVNLSSGDIEWILGQKGDFTMADEDLFFRQHAPEVQPNGNIVLFDNGTFGTREHSRAIEIAYDTTEMTAEVVWEYRPSPDIFTPIWGDADRLQNGNTLVTFGRSEEGKASHIIEADDAGNKVWQLVTPDTWGWYRAERVVSPPKGHIVE